jgi:hypothetical protein
MVDTIRFVLSLWLCPQWIQDEFAAQLAITPAATANGAPAQRRISITVGNINIRLNASGEVVFENSLHRFYHGHNGGSFTRADVTAATQKLSDTLGFNVSNCQLTKVAFGPNLTGLDGQATLLALTDYKGKRFLKYEKGKGITGAKRLLTELDIKLYDKKRELADKRQAQLLVPTLRYEITSRKLAYLRRLKATTVAALDSTEFFKAAGDELIARLEACGFAEQLDQTLLSADEVEALALVNSPLFAAYAANRANKDRTPRRRKLAEQARAKATLTNTKADLLARLKSTLAGLA